MASLFGSIIDFIFDGKDFDSFDLISNNVKKNKFSSIAAKASEGILQFPVIMSNSISYSDAILITKACERAYASFASVVFSMNRDLSDAHTANVSDYISAFHQNDGLVSSDSDKSSLVKAANTFESFTFKDEKTGETITCEYHFPDKPIMSSLLKEELKPFIEDFCMKNLNDIYQPRRMVNAAYTINLEASNSGKKQKYTIGQVDKIDKFQKIENYREADTSKERSVIQKNGIGDKELFMSSEVKKANEMQPTFIKLKVSRTENLRTVEYEIIIGIKATLHVVKTNEFVTNLVDACEYKGTLFRFIKWTSGEINFIRDFVLRMDLFAKETKNRAQGNSGWWEALKKRARSAKISKVNSNRLLPNTTFVFTVEEADYIKANFGYDMMSMKIAKGIMKEYFLLGYIVVDTANEIIHVLYDGQKNFQTFTFRALEKEGSSTERQLRDFSNIMKKM